MTMNADVPPDLRRRPAFAAAEIALSILLLAVVMTTTVHVLGLVAGERRAVERRELAIQEAANVMERLTAEPWDGVTPELARGIALSDGLRRALPGPELAIEVDEKDAAAGSKRVAVRLRWRNRAGGWEAPVRVTAWITRPRSTR
jgi:hypothetical protein